MDAADPNLVARIRERAAAVRERIGRAAQRSGRDPSTVRLVTVTKGHPPEVVRAAVAAGLTLLGENYVEEALPKMEAAPGQAEWHMIGHVQSRKAEQVVQHFAMAHALDSLRLARRLERFTALQGKVFPVLLECNVSGEASKYGFAASEPGNWAELLPIFLEIAALEHVRPLGLMTMAPLSESPEAARPFFRRLSEMRSWLRREAKGTGWEELSMGMSDDFEVAVEEGATLVRIGRAILGPRPPQR